MFMVDLCKEDEEEGRIVFRSGFVGERLGECFSKFVLENSGLF